MSAHAGIYAFAGAPIPPPLVARLSVTNDEHGPDAHDRHIAGHVALLHWAQHFDRFSRLEQQPHMAAPGIWILWDGRLDNRSDLQLQLHRDVAPPYTDVALVGAAYRRWGRNALARLEGDWSLAIYDESRDDVTLARDYLGVRPLYYATLPGMMAWSSCLTPLVACLPDAEEFDDAYIAQGLTYRTQSNRTVYRRIRAVPPAHYVVCSLDGCSEPARYWDYDPSARIRYTDEREYGDHLRQLFSEAVAARLRTDRPVWAHVSGGYDSSAVACLSHWLTSTQEVPARELHLLSYVFSRSRESDERVYMRHVEAWCGQEAVRIDADTIETGIDEIANHADPFISTAPPDPVDAVLSQHSGGSLLTGEFGDLVTAKPKAHCVALIELLERGKLVTFWRELMQWSVRTSQPVHLALGRVLRGLMPADVDRYLYRRAWHTNMQRAFRTSDRDLGGAFGLSPRLLASHPPEPLSFHHEVRRFHPSKRVLVRSLYQVAGKSRVMTPESLRAAHVTHPYAHRPLVNFVLAIPHRALWKVTTNRALMKSSLACVLPDGVLRRGNKGDASPSLSREMLGLMDVLGSDYDNWHLVRREYADARALSTRLTEIANGISPGATHFTRMLLLEAWLRGAAKRRGATGRRVIAHMPRPAAVA
jgi:hypothetical protein